jgi:hypothetical protein
LQKSVEGSIADIDAGDERDLEFGLEWTDDRAHLMNRAGLAEVFSMK